MNKLTIIAAAASLTMLAACDKRDETVGQQIDQSVATAETRTDNAVERSGDAMQRGGEKVADATTDAGVTAKVKTALLSAEDVGGLKIDVDTKAGVVTLKGDVKSQDEKSRAERVASGVEGVQSVVNDLRIAG